MGVRQVASLLAVAAVLAFAGAASANTVPNWFWRWATWYEHGKVGARPAAAPDRIPQWSWRLLRLHATAAAKHAAAANGTKAGKASPPAAPAPAPAPPVPSAPAPVPVPVPAPVPPPPPPPAPAPPPPAPAPAPPPPAPSGGLNASESALLSAVNAARAANGVGALAIDPALETAARSHTQDLLDNNVFTHDFIKDGVAYPFATWIRWYYSGVCAAENLATGPSLSGSMAVQLWLGSPGHRANLLSSSFRTIGVALQAKNGVSIATTDFGGC